MAFIEDALEQKYIQELGLFYKSNLRNIENSMIVRFLLFRKYFPGTRPFEIIHNYFQRNVENQYPCFLLLQTQFQEIRKDLRRYFYFLVKNRIIGKSIIKYQNLLTEFFGYILLNELRIVDVKKHHLRHYLTLDIFRDYHTLSDNFYLIDAVYYFKKMKQFRDADPEKPDWKPDNSCLEKNINEEVSINILNFTENRNLRIVFYLILKTGLDWRTIINIRKKDINFIWQVIGYNNENSDQKYIYMFDSDTKLVLMNYLLDSQSSNLICLPNKYFKTETFEKTFIHLFTKELKSLRISISDKTEFLDRFYEIKKIEKTSLNLSIRNFLKNPLPDTI